MAAILLMPTPGALPVAGHRMLAVLCLAVIVWVTEANDDAVSAVVIAVLQSIATPGMNIVGVTMLLQGVTGLGFILVVSALQNVVAYGTVTFEVREFVGAGLVLTAIAFALFMLLGARYWR